MGSVVLRLLLAATTALALIPDSRASALERLTQYGVGVPTGASGGIGVGSGVAVSPEGTVVVADVGAARLSFFSQSGRFLRALGRDVSIAAGDGPEVCSSDCQYGSSGAGAGELNGPWGVVAGPDEVYVSELGNSRVSAFDYQGRFLRAFGADVGGSGVDLCSSACLAGSSGAAAGEMAGPAGIALDASGHLLVAELGSNRIDVFDPRSGRFLRTFDKDAGGGYGLSVLPSGEVFVSEQGSSRVSVFSAEGRFLRTFGGPGPGAGELAGPYGIAVSAAGMAYVADSANNRLAAFDSGGAFRWALGLDVSPGEPLAPETCAVSCQAGIPGFGIGEFTNPQGVAVDCRGAVYVAMLGRVDKFGAGDARNPPCPAGDPSGLPPGAGSSRPLGSAGRSSNDFRFGRRRHNLKRGTLIVTVSVPGAGTLAARAGRKRRLRARVPQPAEAGTVSIAVRAAGRKIGALRRKGRLRGVLSVTFTPTGGDPRTRSSPVRLVRRTSGISSASNHGPRGS